MKKLIILIFLMVAMEVHPQQPGTCNLKPVTAYLLTVTTKKTEVYKVTSQAKADSIIMVALGKPFKTEQL